MEPPPLNVPFELTPVEREVVAAARAGRKAELSDHAGAPDGDAIAAEGEWPVARAEVLAALCTDEGAKVQRTGVWLQGAVVEGDLDLRWVQLRGPLRLEHCRFRGRVLLADASGKEIALDHCTLEKGLEASRLRLDGCLSLVGTVARGRVALDHARIGGDLDCAGARLRVPRDVALLAEGVDVAADVLLGALDRSDRPVLDRDGDPLCFEADGEVGLVDVTIGGSLNCSGGRFANTGGAALSADRTNVTGGVFLDRAVDRQGQPVAGRDGNPLRFEADGAVRLHGAGIGGQLVCSGGRFTNAGGNALAADGANVTGDVFLNLAVDGQGQPVAGRDGQPLRFEADGEVRLPGATIGGQLVCSGGRFTNAGGNALATDTAKVTGGVFLNLAVDREGQPVAGRDGAPLRFEADGTVRLHGAGIGGQLSCRGGRLTNPGGVALAADGAKVTGAVLLDRAVDGRGRPVAGPDGVPLRFEVDGKIRLHGATIGGQLVCSGGRFTNPGGDALATDGAKVTGGVFLDLAVDGQGRPVAGRDAVPLRFEADGVVRLHGATIGQLSCSGGRFTNPGGDALAADTAQVTGAVFLDLAVDRREQPVAGRDGNPLRFEVDGAVRLHGATIGGQLVCSGGRFTNPGGHALATDGASVTGGVFLDLAVDGQGQPVAGPDGAPLRFEADGDVRLPGATIGGNFFCWGGRFTNSQGTALDSRHVRVTGAFRWSAVALSGRVDLRGAAVGVLDDDIAGWRQQADAPLKQSGDGGGPQQGLDERRLLLDGFAYAGLSVDAPKRWRDRRDWLGLQEVYASQPYRQLAKVYRDAGDDRAARKVAMEQFNAQLGRRDVDLPRRTWLWRWVLRATVGHGYEPWRALGWAVGLWLVGWAWVVCAVQAGAIVPARVSPPPASATAAGPTSPTGAVLPETATVGTPQCGLRASPCLEPALYAADLVFPIVNLGQRENWRPSGPWRYRAIVPVLVIAGWTLTTLVVAGFTSLVRRE